MIQNQTQTPRTDALAHVNAGRPHNHGLAPGNPGYEGLDAYKNRKYAEMTTLARQLERDNARLRAVLAKVEQLIDQPAIGGWSFTMANMPEDLVREVRAALAGRGVA